MSLDIERDFLENLDYLKALANEISCKNPDEFDSNLLYEVAYASLYIDKLALSDESLITGELKELSALFRGIINLVDVDKLKKTNSDYSKLLKTKFKNDDGYLEKDVPYTTNPIEAYMKSHILHFLLLYGVAFVIFLTPRSVIDLIVDWISKAFNFDLSVLDNIKALESVASILISMLLMLAFMIGVLGAVIDMLYLSMPIMREYFNRRDLKIVSDDAIMCLDDKNFYMKKVKSADRIERNKFWLSSLSGVVDKDTEFGRAVVTLDEEIKSAKGKDLYFCAAKIELLRNKAIEFGLV